MAVNQYDDLRVSAIAHDPYGDAEAMNRIAPSDGNEGAHMQTRAWDQDASLAHRAYDRNHRAIPGLSGFGAEYPNRLPAAWTKGPGPHIHDRVPSTVGAVYAAEAQASYEPTDMMKSSHPNATAEMSDGELEDLYDPTAEAVSDPFDSHVSGKTVGHPPSYSPQISSDRNDAASENAKHDNRSGSTHQSHSSNQLEKARDEARDAIMRLWPLQVRYENYLENGIDKSLLQGLFMELGLSFETQSQEAATRAQVTDASAHAPQMGPSEARSNVPSDDKSESRKDRIARLLAAKKSRPQPVQKSTESQIKTPVLDKSKQPPAKSADKSKLLYEKMEALRKSREAKAQTIVRKTEAGNQQHDNQDTMSNLKDVHVPHDEALGPQTSAISPSSVSQPGATTSVSTVAAQSQHAPRTIAQKRPVASDFLSHQEPPPKRPFSQTDNTRPFLIDVSDDEDSDDDTAMDIDSPEQRPLTLRRNGTEDLALRNYPPLSDLSSNGGSTPNAGSARGNANHGKEDLDKMHRNIEEMKRRIAEAEARKRAKGSRQGTPLQMAAAARSEGSLASPTGAVIASDVSVLPETAVTGQSPAQPKELTASLPETPSGSPGQTAKPNLRRSLSRAALDRIAIIEADRKRQTLKMRILRAQIAQMEKEMAASLAEEEALRTETMSPSPEPDAVDTPLREPDSTTLQAVEQPNQTEPTLSAADTQQSTATSLEAHAVTEVPVVDSQASPKRNDDVARTAPISSDGQSMETSEVSDIARDADAASPDAEKPDSPTIQVPQVEAEVTRSQSDISDSDSSTSASDDESMQEPDAEDSELFAGDDDAMSPDGQLSEPGAQYDPKGPDDEMTVSGIGSIQSDANQQGHIADGSVVAPSGHMDNSVDVETTDPCSMSPRSLTSKQVTHLAQEPTSADEGPGSSFQPYESPLQYFHAYRFHPEYNKTVKGGLRSLTYSNKLDVRQQLCPDELLGQACPRGTDCDFQHLNTVAAPDDHILMQLGSYGAHEGNQQQEFNKGLRKLLTEFRDQKVKDFQTISQAIIDYRAQFHQDRSRILPLGNVSL